MCVSDAHFRFLKGPDTQELRHVCLTLVHTRELRDKYLGTAPRYYGGGHSLLHLSPAELLCALRDE